jgi:predicted alpha/beta superfamily hydrolase
MRRILILLVGLFVVTTTQAQLAKVATGKLIRYDKFESDFVDARNVEVWLPDGYSSEKKYAVLYMHDGQMLFDASTTWNKQEWGVDETIGRLIAEGKIKDCIVVGIWNNDDYRSAEYFPQRAWDNLSSEQQDKLAAGDSYTNETLRNKVPQADNYLRFLVRELKPFIDGHYSTLPDMENTFILGSSMGGLISCYAISEYPGIFGGAACLSTHWPASSGIVLDYVADNLPNPATHKIYFDYGTATLDSLYQPYQEKVDEMMVERGYRKEDNWITRKFEGAMHDENAWRSRLHFPLEFLLGK